MLNQQARETMIRQQLRTGGVTDPAVLRVVNETPREAFVPPAYRSFAYADFRIPLANGQEMFYPEDEALILQALSIQSTDQILEIGTGSGYFTALLAQLGGAVTSVDICQSFIDAARSNPLLTQYRGINWMCGDASKGPLKVSATYDIIFISGGLYFLPPAYLEALNPGGRLVAIIGQPEVMDAMLYTKTGAGLLQKRLFETVTPYLVNAQPLENFKF
ncbi:MAG: protein-L-isoaspartate O-methyltransferase [Gammaproteobacteria bacterium]|jgi:protein-L-isoaspartate(D-aspartate) O-methyltransferase|nr:protein-L-isoaspartate O-methyltransferase [Gammaproteobacteria bacterium]